MTAGARRRLTGVASSALLVSGSIVYLYLTLFRHPAIPVINPANTNQSIPLLSATRMQQGEVIYRDFFSFLTPGTEVAYWASFTVFGARMWIPYAMLTVIGAIFAWLLYRLARTTVGGWAVLLPSLLFLTFSFRPHDAYHQWFSAAIALGAAAVLAERTSTGRLLTAGGLCGLCTFFTQSRGPLVLLALALFVLLETRLAQTVRSRLSPLGALLGGFAAVSIATLAWFVWHAGPARFVDATILFPLMDYPGEARDNTMRAFLAELPGVPPLANIPLLLTTLSVHALVPAVYLVALFGLRHSLRNERKDAARVIWLCCAIGLALFLGIAQSPAAGRLAAVSAPGWIVLAWALPRFGTFGRAASYGLLAVAAAIAVGEPAYRQLVQWHGTLELPAGPVTFVTSQERDQYKALLELTSPGDYFYAPASPYYYFPLGLRDPADVPFVAPNRYTRPEQVQEVVASLQRKRVKIILWSRAQLDAREDIVPTTDPLGPLREYLRSNYRHVGTAPNGDEVWKRVGS